MAQEGLHARVVVHPSGLIQVSGKTEAGRELTIYLGGANVELLRQVFALAEQHGLTGERLGHAYWHIREGRPAPCESCKQ